MKRLLLVLLLAAGTAHAAGVPGSVPFQGTLLASSGVPVDGTFSMTFAAYDAASGGNLLWATASPITVTATGGVFEAQLQPPASLFVGAADVWIEGKVGTESPLPRAKLGVVPYAVQALRADAAVTALDLACSGCVGSGDLAANLSLGGTTTLGDVQVGGKVGIGKTPQVALDVAGTVRADAFVGPGGSPISGMSEGQAGLLVEMLSSPLVDLDSDGLANSDEPLGDYDGDGASNALDPDADDDGVLDGEDAAPLDETVQFHPVTNFTATLSGADVLLAWTKSASSAATYTRIVRKSTGYPLSPSDGTVVGTTTAATLTDGGLPNGTYYYRAWATNGTLFSAGVNAAGPQVVDVKARVWAVRYNSDHNGLPQSWIDLPGNSTTFSLDSTSRVLVAMTMGGYCSQDGCHGYSQGMLDSSPGPAVLYMGGPGQWHQASTNFVLHPSVGAGSHTLKMQHYCGNGTCNMNSNGERSFFVMAVPPSDPQVRVFGAAFDDSYSSLSSSWTTLSNSLTFDLAVESDVLIAMSSGGNCSSDGCHGYHRYLLDGSKTSDSVIYMGGPGQWHQSSTAFMKETLQPGSHTLTLQHACGGGTCNLNSNGERGFMVVAVPKGSDSYRVFSARFLESQGAQPGSWTDINNPMSFTLATRSKVAIGLTGGGYCTADGCHGYYRYRINGGAPSESTIYMGGPGQWHQASTNFFEETLDPGSYEIRLEHTCGAGSCLLNSNAVRSLMVVSIPAN
ncbi:MAG: hypothetical protein AMXMBFR64_23150 [Myxococcales bacterium]